MKPLRVLALCHESLVPREGVLPTPEGRTEADVVGTLRGLGHEVQVLGMGGDLRPLRRAVYEFKPHVAFNLLEGFDEVVTWDHNVVSYLEMLGARYTGCNARGLMLGRDKAIAKKLLAYHRIAVPEFVTYPRGRTLRRRPRWLSFPLIVKSLTLDASIGISQASVVEDDEKLRERIRFVHESLGTDALVESYIDGRELYVGILGNQRLTALPVWELSFAGMPEESRKIATERLKWNRAYQEKHRIETHAAVDLLPELAERIQSVCLRTYRILYLSGYARVDLRLAADGRLFVLEANPNPQLARDEDFAVSAAAAGLPYERLLERIVALGLRWEPRRLG